MNDILNLHHHALTGKLIYSPDTNKKKKKKKESFHEQIFRDRQDNMKIVYIYIHIQLFRDYEC